MAQLTNLFCSDLPLTVRHYNFLLTLFIFSILETNVVSNFLFNLFHANDVPLLCPLKNQTFLKKWKIGVKRVTQQRTTILL